MHRRDLLQVLSNLGGAGSVARCADAAGPVPCRSGFGVSIARAARFGPRQVMPKTDDAMFYQLYFQTPGVAEAELESDVWRLYARHPGAASVLLALEVAPSCRPPSYPGRHSRSGPNSKSRQCALRCSAHSWRVAELGSTSPVDGRQVHDQAPRPALTWLAGLSVRPHRAHRRHRLVRTICPSATQFAAGKRLSDCYRWAASSSDDLASLDVAGESEALHRWLSELRNSLNGSRSMG